METYAHLSHGTLAECAECRDWHAPDDPDEAGFGRQQCDLCRTSQAGMRYVAHGISSYNGAMTHLDICEDCMLELH